MKILNALSLILLLVCSMLAAEMVHSQNIADSIFEGDIIADYDTINSVYDEKIVIKLVEEGVIEDETSFTRGTSPQFNLWNKQMNAENLFVISAYIDPQYTAEEHTLIKKAVKKLAKKSGALLFKFPKVKPTDGRPLLNYQGRSSGMCASYVGMKNSATSSQGQPIYLDMNCLTKGTIQHETMHALGFWHEQSRSDRDEHVTINWGNISNGKEINFSKQSSAIDSLGAPYDYDSVMHYHAHAFSSNGSKTITVPGEEYIGQRTGFSYGDRLQLRLLYQCEFGPRPLADFKAERCNTSDCKCGRNWKGCGTEDDNCKGSLVCINDKCKQSQTQWDYSPSHKS